MNEILNLIGLYCTICDSYDSRLYENVQRLSNNNSPEFTDAEVLTVYIWGLKEKLTEQKAICNLTATYLSDCFPKLPSYQAFSRRLGELSPALETLAEQLVEAGCGDHAGESFIMDSLPVVVGHTRQRRQPRSAGGLCSEGYCSTKHMHYYGVKVSIVGKRREGTLPFPVKSESARRTRVILPWADGFWPVCGMRWYMEIWDTTEIRGDESSRSRTWNCERR